MKRIFTLLITCSLLSVSITDAVGQNAKLRYADSQYALSNFMEAAKGYEKAYAKKATYRAAKGAAASFDLLSLYPEAYKWWKLAIDFEESNSEDFSNYIFATHQVGKLHEVKAALERSTPKGELSNGNFDMDSLLAWYSRPKNVKLVSLDLYNSSSADFGISFDKEGNTYFSSDRGDISFSGKKPIRIDGTNKFSTNKYDMTGRDFIGIYKKDEKNEIAPILSTVPNSLHFSDPFFLKEKPTMFYTLTRDLGKLKGKRNYSIFPELYFSTLNAKGELVDYHPFPLNSPTEHGVINPFVDEKEKKVYFSSNRSGGFGGYDLYYVTYDEDFNFGPPVNLGAAINTSGDERDPFIFRDKFYFSSDGHVGLGGLDIFLANFDGGVISHVRNMGLPFNSPQDDFAMKQTEEGDIYLSSNRLNGTGLDDIYQVEDVLKRFVGRVMDNEGNRISNGLYVELKQEENLNEVDLQHKEKGEFHAAIAPEQDYQLVIKKEGYFPIQDTSLTTKGLAGDLLEKEYVMTKIPHNAAVLEEIIFYDLDQSQLRADATAVMNQVVGMMKDYSFLEIIVRSHTDSRASKEYNKALSERRANAVREFLAQHGIAGSRVSSEWFGEEKLLNDCGDAAPCPESAHQANRRSELILIAFPDQNKAYELPIGFESIRWNELKELTSL